MPVETAGVTPSGVRVTVADNGIATMLLDQPGERLVDLPQSLGIGLGRMRANAARVDKAQLSVLEGDHPEAAGRRPRIDSECDHRVMVAAALIA